MSTKKPPNDSKTSNATSVHDAAAAIISTAIGMQNEVGLPLKMRNIPGRGFAIVIEGWYYDGRNLSRQPPENIVANGSGKPGSTVVAN